MRTLSPGHEYVVTYRTLGKAIALLCPQTSGVLHRASLTSRRGDLP